MDPKPYFEASASERRREHIGTANELLCYLYNMADWIFNIRDTTLKQRSYY